MNFLLTDETACRVLCMHAPEGDVPMKAPPGVLLRLLAVLALLFIVAGTGPPVEANADRKAVQDKKPDLTKYVGSDTCQACHTDLFKSFEATPHWKTMLDKRGGPAKQGCESCHGPGKEHVEGGGDKTKITLIKQLSAKNVSETCLTCHQYGEEHSNFEAVPPPGERKPGEVQ
jgi:hypothetical protein